MRKDRRGCRGLRSIIIFERKERRGFPVGRRVRAEGSGGGVRAVGFRRWGVEAAVDGAQEGLDVERFRGERVGEGGARVPGRSPGLARTARSSTTRFCARRARVPPRSRASRAFMQRLRRTGWIWVGLAVMDQRLGAMQVSKRMFSGKGSPVTMLRSRRRCVTWTWRGSPPPPWVKRRIWRTRPAPRSAFFSNIARSWRSPGAVMCSGSIGTPMSRGERTVVRLGAMPEASRPTLARRWARRKWSTRFRCSGRSVVMARRALLSRRAFAAVRRRRRSGLSRGARWTVETRRLSGSLKR